MNINRIRIALKLVLQSVMVLLVMQTSVDGQTEADWHASGSHPKDYEMGGDPFTSHGAEGYGSITSKVSEIDGFGTWVSAMKSEGYLDKKLKMSAYVKTENVKEWTGLWMRVDGPDGAILSFDNMENRKIQGTTDWKKYEIVLDVPASSQRIAFGTLLAGCGKVWTGGLKFDVVDKDVQATETWSSQPDLAERFGPFVGTWEGTLVTNTPVGAEMRWPFHLEGRYLLDSSAVQTEGHFIFSGGMEIAWTNIYTWDAQDQEVVHLEATGVGEINIFRGNWSNEKIPTLELKMEKKSGNNTTTSDLRISFPNDDTMLWDVVWKKNGEIEFIQKLEAHKK